MPIVDRRFVLTKGPPWGFRVYLDNQNVLTISKVRRHSPAEFAKLRTGDQIISLNGKQTSGLNHADAANLIDSTFGTLDIQISRFESTSTKILTFDKVDAKIPDDVKSNVNLNLIRSEKTPEEIKIPEEVKIPEEIKVPLRILESEEYDIKVPEISAPLENLVRPSSPDVQPIPLSKLIKEYNIPDDHEEHVPKKKHFADSSFYNDPYNLYPTTEEKMEMARRVASSLYAPDNKSSKGANIFEKQRKRADKYTLQQEEANVNGFTVDDQKYDLAHWPAVAEHKEKSPSPMYRLGYSSGPPAPPPPPPPPIPNEAKTIQEFMEKVQKFPKAKHNVISPDVCFDIAAALHSSDSRGAQIFAKQKHRAQKWTLSAPETAAAQPLFASSPGPSSSFQQSDNQSKPKVLTVNRNLNQRFNTGQIDDNVNSLTTTRKPTHVIRRNSNQNTVEPANIGNKLSITSVTSNTVTPSSSPTTEPAQQSTTTGAKWKPVKFNIPQRA